MSKFGAPEYHSIASIIFENETIEAPFLKDIDESYGELRTLLPTLPEKVHIIFGTNYDYGDDGVTGSAVSPDAIQVGIDGQATDRARQHNSIRPLIFHEGYHMAQGFHLGSTYSALESAIYEGCATIFERDVAGSTPRWANYSKEGEATLQRWLDEISKISAEQYFEPTGETWRKWAFYDPDTDESWRIYKVGTWLVEKVTAQENKTIIELNSKTSEEIMSYLSTR